MFTTRVSVWKESPWPPAHLLAKKKVHSHSVFPSTAGLQLCPNKVLAGGGGVGVELHPLCLLAVIRLPPVTAFPQISACGAAIVASRCDD